jgi:hypothetical protein
VRVIQRDEIRLPPAPPDPHEDQGRSANLIGSAGRCASRRMLSGRTPPRQTASY